MSNETMNEKEAVLFSQVYAPAFINKCASLGLKFNTEAELSEALDTAALVKIALSRQNTGIMKSAQASLKQALNIKEAAQQKPAISQIGKQAAAMLAKNPDILAALS